MPLRHRDAVLPHDLFQVQGAPLPLAPLVHVEINVFFQFIDLLVLARDLVAQIEELIFLERARAARPDANLRPEDKLKQKINNASSKGIGI